MRDTTPVAMRRIAEFPAETARGIRWFLTDIDDTMTRDGKLVPEAYQALCDLAAAGLRVIAVTGRSAGWGMVHLQEWPICGAIAENGAVAYYPGGELIYPGTARNTDPSLRRAFAAALKAVPRAVSASDNPLRLFDCAIDHAERVRPPLTEEEIGRITAIFESEGCVAKPSSIHVNCWKGSFNKRDGAVAFLTQIEGYDDRLDRHRVFYVGDAPNDEPMFGHFPNACGVANINEWLDRIEKLPAWVAQGSHGEGFAEIAGVLLRLRADESMQD